MNPSLEASYRRRWFVLAVLCLSVLLVVVSNMALNVALPILGRELHAGVSSLAWVVDIYVLCFAGLLANYFIDPAKRLEGYCGAGFALLGAGVYWAFLRKAKPNPAT